MRNGRIVRTEIIIRRVNDFIKYFAHLVRNLRITLLRNPLSGAILSRSTHFLACKGYTIPSPLTNLSEGDVVAGNQKKA